VGIQLIATLFESSTVVVTAAAEPTPELEWTAVVEPITWSPVTARRDRLTARPEPFLGWNTTVTGYSTYRKLAGTIGNYYRTST